MYPDSVVKGLDRFLPCIIFAIAWSDVSLAALAYRLNIKATVTARAVVEPWTISIAAWVMSYVSFHDGLVLSYVASMAAAMIASVIPRSEEHTSELQSLMRISYAAFCLKNKNLCNIYTDRLKKTDEDFTYNIIHFVN